MPLKVSHAPRTPRRMKKWKQGGKLDVLAEGSG